MSISLTEHYAVVDAKQEEMRKIRARATAFAVRLNASLGCLRNIMGRPDVFAQTVRESDWAMSADDAHRVFAFLQNGVLFNKKWESTYEEVRKAHPSRGVALYWLVKQTRPMLLSQEMLDRIEAQVYVLLTESEVQEIEKELFP